jgi:hypothetical protein
MMGGVDDSTLGLEREATLSVRKEQYENIRGIVEKGGDFVAPAVSDRGGVAVGTTLSCDVSYKDKYSVDGAAVIPAIEYGDGDGGSRNSAAMDTSGGTITYIEGTTTIPSSDDSQSKTLDYAPLPAPTTESSPLPPEPLKVALQRMPETAYTPRDDFTQPPRSSDGSDFAPPAAAAMASVHSHSLHSSLSPSPSPSLSAPSLSVASPLRMHLIETVLSLPKAITFSTRDDSPRHR